MQNIYFRLRKKRETEEWSSCVSPVDIGRDRLRWMSIRYLSLKYVIVECFSLSDYKILNCRQFDAARGMDYMVDLVYRDVNNEETIERRIHLARIIG